MNLSIYCIIVRFLQKSKFSVDLNMFYKNQALS